MSFARWNNWVKPLGLGLGAAVLTACQPYRYERPVPTTPEPGPPVVQPAISSSGNPAFYDVLGKRYFVMKSRDGYQERGVASWYGPKFHGKSTASGERYDMHGMTAAHKTLAHTHLGGGHQFEKPAASFGEGQRPRALRTQSDNRHVLRGGRQIRDG